MDAVHVVFALARVCFPMDAESQQRIDGIYKISLDGHRSDGRQRRHEGRDTPNIYGTHVMRHSVISKCLAMARWTADGSS